MKKNLTLWMKNANHAAGHLEIWSN